MPTGRLLGVSEPQFARLDSWRFDKGVLIVTGEACEHQKKVDIKVPYVGNLQAILGEEPLLNY